jgi:hypothetical protein
MEIQMLHDLLKAYGEAYSAAINLRIPDHPHTILLRDQQRRLKDRAPGPQLAHAAVGTFLGVADRRHPSSPARSSSRRRPSQAGSLIKSRVGDIQLAGAVAGMGGLGRLERQHALAQARVQTRKASPGAEIGGATP